MVRFYEDFYFCTNDDYEYFNLYDETASFYNRYHIHRLPLHSKITLELTQNSFNIKEELSDMLYTTCDHHINGNKLVISFDKDYNVSKLIEYYIENICSGSFVDSFQKCIVYLLEKK